jgi:hypothetical protein
VAKAWACNDAFSPPFAALSLAGCATFLPPERETLDAIARDYVVLQLAIGEKEEGLYRRLLRR